MIETWCASPVSRDGSRCQNHRSSFSWLPADSSQLSFSSRVVLLILGVNAKRQVQTLVSEALEMEVNVAGRLDIGFFLSLHVTMENVQVRNRGSEIASAAQASLGIELFPLLQKEVRMDSVGLKHVRIAIERQRDGRFNFETRTELKRRFPPTDIGRVSLSDATLLYTDQQSGEALVADSCDLDVRHLQLSKKKNAVPLRSLSFTAVLTCGEIRQKISSCPK
jgi:uncharacterized protein involved in outer membrane biogenesis